MLDAPQDVLMQKGVVCNTHIPYVHLISTSFIYLPTVCEFSECDLHTFSSYHGCRVKMSVISSLVLGLKKLARFNIQYGACKLDFPIPCQHKVYQPIRYSECTDRVELIETKSKVVLVS